MNEQLFLQDVTSQSYNHRIIVALRKIMRAVGIYSRKLKAEYDITSPQLISLMCISEREPVSISEISSLVHLSASTVVGIVDRLEQKGYVKRHRSTDDRRRMDVEVTDEGKKVIATAPSLLQDKFSENLNGLSEIEKVSITLGVEKVVALMEADDIDASPILHNQASVLKKGSTEKR